MPGCATGQEAFSIAITQSEYLNETGKTFPVQIFASDISEQAIETARAGQYLENIAADVSADRLKRYFTRVDNRYQVNKDLREMCVFTRHNLLSDPPFSKLDLISCRNVLIYLASVQKNVIPLFHYALKPNGFLLLGQSETAAFPELFSLLNRDQRIYSKHDTARKSHPFSAGLSAPFGGASAGTRPAGAHPAELWDRPNARHQVDRLLLSRYSPAGVVVDEDLEVLEIRGKASKFLSLPMGKASFSLLKLIPSTSLFLEVEKLVHEVRRTGEAARQDNIQFDGGGGTGGVTVEVLPLQARQKNSLLILFEDAHLQPSQLVAAPATAVARPETPEIARSPV